VRARVLDLARTDPRVTAGALTGSTAVGADDDRQSSQFGVLDHFDLRSGSTVYRVFLLPSGLEVDVAVTPHQAFGARGPRFRTLFGPTR
jgi:hypothetical protein